MKKGLLLIFVALIFTAPLASVFAQTNPPATEGRALEIIYPVLSGEDEDLALGPDTDLASYVRYIFRFALVITGFIILYVMISAGLAYVMSSGNAETLLNAKKGILSGFLGALILIGAFLLFNTINPDLTKLGKIDDLQALDPIITPGIYLCNYNPNNVPSLISIAGNVQGLIALYKNFDADISDRVNATRELRDVMSNGVDSCYRVRFSANLTKKDLDFRNDGTNLMFSIPERIYDNPDTPFDENDWEYNYGIIFHEKNSWKGECSLNTIVASYINPTATVLSSSTPFSFSSSIIDIAKSVTLFEKPITETSLSDVGVGLYQCLDYLTTDKCPPGLTGTGGYAVFPTSGRIRYIPRNTPNGIGGLDPYNLAGSSGTPPSGSSGQGSFGNFAPPAGTTYTEAQRMLGTRSVVIDPEGAYFAIMFSGENYDGDICEVISKSDNNLLDQPIGQCGNTCRRTISDDKKFLRDCVPCLKSMIVVKGNVIY